MIAPDPSIVRVGKDYYVVNSSFAWFPGLPIYHSRDLVNWRQIGNAITSTDNFKLSSIAINRGIFAPTIRWHEGLFYIITTCIECRGEHASDANVLAYLLGRFGLTREQADKDYLESEKVK